MTRDDENVTNPPPVPPTLQAPHTISTIKLHILKKGEYDIWAIKMEHYLAHTDYLIWGVIQKGNGPVQVSTDTNGQIRVFPPKTAEEILARKREKEKQGLPCVSTEDANQKFLRSLPSSWSQVSLITRTKPRVDMIMRTKQRVDTLSFDDIYNNLRVFKSDVKDYEDLEQVDEFDLEEMDLKWQVAMISIRLKKFYKKTGRKLHFDAKEPVGFDKTKFKCLETDTQEKDKNKAKNDKTERKMEKIEKDKVIRIGKIKSQSPRSSKVNPGKVKVKPGNVARSSMKSMKRNLPDQMVSGKDSSNPLMADNLPKIVWYSTHHVALMKSLLVQKQTALCKDESNPFIVDSLLKTLWLIVTAVSLKSIDCLPNEEIFTELSTMGYEKPSTKLTFYKAFFSPQWKFLIHTILKCMSAKRTSWNEFSSSMASAVICLSTGRKFNFSKAQVSDLSSHSTKYSSSALTQKVFANMRRVGKGFSGVDTPLFEGMIVAQQDDDVADEGVASVAVDDVPAAVDEPFIPSPSPTTQPPPSLQDLPFTSLVQPTPPSSLIAQPPSPQQQPQPSQDAKISMDLLHTLLETCTTITRRVEHLKQDKIAQTLEIIKLKQRVKKLERRNTLKVFKLRRLKRVGTSQRVSTSEDIVMDDVSKQGRIIANMDADEDVTLKDVVDIAKEVVVDGEIEENAYVQGRQAESQAQIYQIDLEHADKVLSMQDDEIDATITAATTPIPAATITDAPSAARRRKGVVIRDPEETATPSIIIHSEPKSKDKGKRIMVEEPKPLKKQAQIEQDEAYSRELEA
nr:hypothetical protein [Tanacetum cinerariifolium]